MGLKITKMERLMYSIVSPFNKSELGWRCLVDVKEKGILSDEQPRLFVSGTARALLNLNAEIV